MLMVEDMLPAFVDLQAVMKFINDCVHKTDQNHGHYCQITPVYILYFDITLSLWLLQDITVQYNAVFIY